jgi:hypothetical protein
MQNVTCHRCKRTIEREEGSFATGYGIDRHNHTICYACCGILDRKRMERDGYATLYLTETPNGYRVTNWPGSLTFSAHVNRGRHNIAGVRYDAWFWLSGYQWHGVQYGNNTQIVHCKRTKVRH